MIHTHRKQLLRKWIFFVALVTAAIIASAVAATFVVAIVIIYLKMNKLGFF